MTGDKYILFHYPGATDQSFFDENSRDNCCEPFIALKKRCAELGYSLEVTKNQDLNACKWIIFWDVISMGSAALSKISMHGIKNWITGNRTRDIFAEAMARGFNERLTLMLSEPVSVCAQNADISVHNKFKHVFTWDANLADGKRYIRTYLPVTAIYPEMPRIPFSEKKMLVDISGNKVSSHTRELYTERRNTIKYFDRKCPSDFDLYGVGWNPNPGSFLRKWTSKSNFGDSFYQTYRGAVRHKWDILPKYKFNICYENIREERDYVSQRIFDSLRCRSVPIYLGAPNIEEYVDRDAFIDRREFKTLEDMDKYIRCVSDKEYTRYIDAGQAYLKSEKFRLFLSENFVDTIVRTLKIGK